MKEYFDREAACAYRPPEKRERRYSTYNLDDAFDDGYDEHIKQVEAIPAADVRPVVRGRWMAKHWEYESETGEVEVPYDEKDIDQWDCFCSNCGLSALLNGNEKEVPSNYCPNCGADMRGEHDE